MQDHNVSKTISERLGDVQARIDQACLNADRSPSTVNLLAVSKRQPQSLIAEAYGLGVRSFGENIVQEAVDKIEALALPDACWHFIGRLQSNKIKLVARYFNWVQTVTELKQLVKLADYAKQFGRQLQVCLQVKVGDELSKGGISLDAVPALAEQAARCEHVSLRGLMAIPPQYTSQTAWQQGVEAMVHRFEQLKEVYPEIDTLSLGMSGDLEWAVASGSTMVRIGSALFGPRQ